MRSLLLSGTVLAVAGAVSSGGPAGAAERLKLGLGGYFVAHVVYTDQEDGIGEPGAGIRNHAVARESEIHFTGRNRLDNGIAFGFNLQLEGETSTDQIDESYIYAEGGFGQIRFGSDDPATDIMFVGAPVIIARVGLGDPDAVFATLRNDSGAPTTPVSVSGDAEKLTYFTPVVSGFSFGLSYTPDNCEDSGCGIGALRPENTAAQQSEIVEAAANYVTAVGAGEVGLHAAYAKGDLEADSAGIRDQVQWGIGASAAYGDVIFGGSLKRDNQGTAGPNTRRTDYALGMAYTSGRWMLGFEYARVITGVGAGLGEDETEGLQVGGTYDLGPGVILTGGVTFWRAEDNLNARSIENEATSFVFGTVLSF